MKTFWLFRSNLKHLEYYHRYDNLPQFEAECHDFYMLFPIWLLRKEYFDAVVIWRLSDKPLKEINFIVNGRLYSQRWIRNLSEVFNYPKANISFFRGGFKEYDTVTKQKPDHFGLKLYLATGRRTSPQWDGVYDYLLQEDKRDMLFRDHKSLPFYKTASPNIFYPYVNQISNIHYDICWPCNFKQIRYKGQEYFIQTIAKNKDLQKLSIAHCGNKPGVGKNYVKSMELKILSFLVK